MGGGNHRTRGNRPRGVLVARDMCRVSWLNSSLSDISCRAHRRFPRHVVIDFQRQQLDQYTSNDTKLITHKTVSKFRPRGVHAIRHDLLLTPLTIEGVCNPIDHESNPDSSLYCIYPTNTLPLACLITTSRCILNTTAPMQLHLSILLE